MRLRKSDGVIAILYLGWIAFVALAGWVVGSHQTAHHGDVEIQSEPEFH